MFSPDTPILEIVMNAMFLTTILVLLIRREEAKNDVLKERLREIYREQEVLDEKQVEAAERLAELFSYGLRDKRNVEEVRLRDGSVMHVIDDGDE